MAQLQADIKSKEVIFFSLEYFNSLNIFLEEYKIKINPFALNINIVKHLLMLLVTKC